MQLFVQGHALHTVDVSAETSVQSLKGLVAELEGIPGEEQVLSYGGVPLEEDCLLCGLVPELGTVTVSARVVGGAWTAIRTGDRNNTGCERDRSI